MARTAKPEPKIETLGDVNAVLEVTCADEQAMISKRLTSPAAQADFFRVLRERFGFAAREAYAAVNWSTFLALMALDKVEDIDGEANWAELVGVSDDVSAIEEWYDRAIDPELFPGTITDLRHKSCRSRFSTARGRCPTTRRPTWQSRSFGMGLKCRCRRLRSWIPDD